MVFKTISLNAGQKYCRMLQREHSAILLTFIKLPFVIKIFVLYIFEWQFYTGFTVDELKNLKTAESIQISLFMMRVNRKCNNPQEP